MKTKNLSVTTIREALGWGNSIYRMNASQAVGYSFSKNKQNKGISCGEFMYTCDQDRIPDYDGYICFINRTILDTQSGEKIKIVA